MDDDFKLLHQLQYQHYKQYKIRIAYIYKVSMYPEPRYLKLEQQLFPSITLYKQLIFDSQQDDFHYEMFERVAYDSQNRTIDLTESLQKAVKKVYKQQVQLQILVCDPLVQDFRLLTYFPFENNITLGEQFLQLDVLMFRFKTLSFPTQLFEELEIANIPSEKQVECESNEAAGAIDQKIKRRKTIREMLQVVDEWRKLCIKTNWKISIQQGADIIGISKRSLLFYFHHVKLGERYGFKFEANLDNKISQLTNFVNQKVQVKKKEQIELLTKLKSYYK